MISRKTFGRVILAAVLLLFSAAPYLAAQSAADYETVKVNQQQIDFYLRNIAEEEKAMSEAMRIALGGSVGEFQKWRDLAAAVDRYEQVFSDRIPEIDRCVRNIIEAVPATRLPSLAVGDPFVSRFEQVEKRLAEIRRAEKEVDDQVAFIDRKIAELNVAIANATQQAVGEVAEGFLPSEAGLAGKGAIVIFSAWFGPPGIAAGMLAVGISYTFNQFVNVYYSASGLVDQVKRITDFQKDLRERRAALLEVKASYQPALQEMRAIDQELRSHKARFDALRGRLEGLVDGWRALAGNVIDKKGQEIEEQFEERREEAAEADPVNLTWRHYHVGWGAPAPAPIEAHEYVPEANSRISPLFERYRITVDGGNPENFFDLSDDIRKSASDFVESARESERGALRSFESAVESYWRSASAASSAYSSTVGSLSSRYRAGSISWSAYESGRSAAWSRYVSAVQAARATVAPSATALSEARRETARRQQLYWSVRSGISQVHSLLYQQSALLVSLYHAEREAWERKSGLAGQEYLIALNLVPASWQIRNFEWSLASFERNMQDALLGTNVFNRATPPELRASLEGMLASISATEETWRRHRPGVVRARDEVNRLNARAITELEAFLYRHQDLMALGWGWDSRWLFENKAERARSQLASRFAALPPLDDVPDFGRFRSEVNRLIGSLREWLDWIEFYNGRLEVAEHRISTRTGPVIGSGLYAARPSIDEYLAGQPGWSALEGRSQVIPAEFRRAWWHGQGEMPGWDNLPLRTKLLYASGSMAMQARQLFQHYERFRAWGGFHHVNQAEMESLRDKWRPVSRLIADFEAFEPERRAKLPELRDQVAEFKDPVFRAYNAMPGWLRRSVDGRHRSFHLRVHSLESFLNAYIARVAPLVQESSVPYLDNIFNEYEAAHQAWQEEIRRREEEAERRRREEEERRRREEEEAERRRREEEAARARTVASVESFYAGFTRLYERRDASGVAGLLDPGWTAADGSTLSDLRETLSNSFRIFDEVSCRITNLAVIPQPDGTARVSYNIAIIGRIHRTRIRHEESSAVTEIVSVDNGRVRILRTLAGRFWQD